MAGETKQKLNKSNREQEFFAFLKDHRGTRMTGEHTFSLQAAVRLLEQLRKLRSHGDYEVGTEGSCWRMRL
jgi:hypothetical protein